MATQTRFDLNIAVENWRNELAAQLALSPDDRRELEKHLADSMAELRGRGLNEEESFWLARKRIGRPQQLAEEFEKADPQKIWRDRAFWLVLGPLAFSLWAGLVNLGHNFNIYHGEESLCRFVLADFLPIIVLLSAQRWAVKTVTAFCAIFKTRWRFAVSAIVFIAITHGYQAFETYQFRIQLAERLGGRLSRLSFGGFWLNQITYNGYPLMLLAVAIWLLPTKKQSRRAEKLV